MWQGPYKDLMQMVVVIMRIGRPIQMAVEFPSKWLFSLICVT